MNSSEEHIAFYSELGLAITQWANIENALFWIVGACFSKADAEQLAVSFFSIENFRSKLSFADSAVCKKYVDTEHLKKWPAILKKLQTLSPNRNKLAHSMVIVFQESAPGRRYALTPWIVKRTKFKSKKSLPPNGSLCLRDIIKIRHEFGALFVSIVRFHDSLQERPELFPESLEQPKGLPTIQQINTQIHAILGHPPKPSRK